MKYKKDWENFKEAKLKEENDHLIQIDKDLPRTFVDNHYFENEKREGRIRLERLLKRFCLINKKIGYCQGMNEIAATIILVVEDDIEAYSIFCEVIQHMKGRRKNPLLFI